MNKKLFLISLIILSTAFLNADRANLSGIPRYCGITPYNVSRYVTNAIMSRPEYSTLEASERYNVLTNSDSRAEALLELIQNQEFEDKIAGNLNQYYHASAQRNLDQTVNTIEKALNLQGRKGKPRVTGLYMTLKGYSALGHRRL
jgi:hypothetical protein